MLTVNISCATIPPTMTKTLQNQADYYSLSGAEELKRRIAKYWTDRGFRGIAVARYQHPDFPGSWFVRSNIGPQGFPPRHRSVTV